LINDNLKNKRLFYTYFDEEKVFEFEIVSVDKFSIHAPKKETVSASCKDMNKKNIHQKNNHKTYLFHKFTYNFFKISI